MLQSHVCNTYLNVQTTSVPPAPDNGTIWHIHIKFFLMIHKLNYNYPDHELLTWWWSLIIIIEKEFEKHSEYCENSWIFHATHSAVSSTIRTWTSGTVSNGHLCSWERCVHLQINLRRIWTQDLWLTHNGIICVGLSWCSRAQHACHWKHLNTAPTIFSSLHICPITS